MGTDFYFPTKPCWAKPKFGDDASLHLKFYFFEFPFLAIFSNANAFGFNKGNLVRSILGSRLEVHGTRGLISWSGSTIAYTWSTVRVLRSKLSRPWKHLDIFDLVRVVANHTWKFYPPDFFQLFRKSMVKAMKVQKRLSKKCPDAKIHNNWDFWPAQEWMRKAIHRSRTRNDRQVCSCGTACLWCTPRWDRPTDRGQVSIKLINSSVM